MVSSNFKGAVVQIANTFMVRPFGLKPSSTSRHSLTVRSSRHPQAPLVGTLRASHSGAAYLGLQGLPHLSSKSFPNQLPLAIDL